MKGRIVVGIISYLFKMWSDEQYAKNYTKGRAQALAEINRQMVPYRKRWQEAKAQGGKFYETPPVFGSKDYLEGFAEGRGRAFTEARWQNIDYHKRMQEAKARGEEFNEPPPMFEDEVNGQEQEQD